MALVVAFGCSCLFLQFRSPLRLSVSSAPLRQKRSSEVRVVPHSRRAAVLQLLWSGGPVGTPCEISIGIAILSFAPLAQDDDQAPQERHPNRYVALSH